LIDLKICRELLDKFKTFLGDSSLNKKLCIEVLDKFKTFARRSLILLKNLQRGP